MDNSCPENEILHPDPPSERFLRLLMSNNKSIYAFIFTLVHDHFNADDIMQETVTFMYRNFDKFEPGSNFAAWGMRIAHYRVLAFHKKQKNTRLHFDVELLDLIRAEADSIHDDINVRLEALQKCRAKLGKNDSEVIKMRYDLDVNIKNIAEYLGQSTHRIYRSVARIHDVLLRCVRKTLAEDYR